MPDDPTIPYPHLPPPPPAPLRPTPVHTGPTVKAAWLAVGSLAAVIGLLYSTFQVVSVVAHNEYDTSVRVTDPAVAVLDVASQGGSIEVIGADVEDVRIDAHVSDGMVATRFTHDVVGDQLQVRVRCRMVVENYWCKADLRIIVPKGLEVKIRSSDDGVSVRGLAGRVDAESDNGTVEAESLAGATRLHSDNGSVRGNRMRTESLQADSGNGSVRLEFATAPLSVIAHSDNGSVDIALPRGDEGYAVDVKSSNGSTDNLVKADPESERRIVAASSNGSVTVRYVD